MRFVNRVQEFLRQHRMQDGTDQEVLKALHIDPQAGMAELRVSDLKALLERVDRRYVLVVILEPSGTTHVYGPYNKYQAHKERKELQDEYSGHRVRIVGKKLVDIERMNMEKAEEDECSTS